MTCPDPKIYIIEGTIGSGKSTLTGSTLAHADLIFGQGAKVVLIRESVFQPFLDLYLEDQSKLAFPFQICMARDRLESMRIAQRHYRKGRIVLVDRGIPGDIAFARLHENLGNITGEQMDVYYGLLGHGVPNFIPPSVVPKDSCCAATETVNFDTNEEDDFLLSSLPQNAIKIVYLRTAPEVAFKRMQSRRNSAEVENYTLKYFKDLSKAYEETISAFKAELPESSVCELRYNYERRVDEDGFMAAKDCLDVWNQISN